MNVNTLYKVASVKAVETIAHCVITEIESPLDLRFDDRPVLCYFIDTLVNLTAILEGFNVTEVDLRLELVVDPLARLEQDFKRLIRFVLDVFKIGESRHGHDVLDLIVAHDYGM